MSKLKSKKFILVLVMAFCLVMSFSLCASAQTLFEFIADTPEFKELYNQLISAVWEPQNMLAEQFCWLPLENINYGIISYLCIEAPQLRVVTSEENISSVFDTAYDVPNNWYIGRSAFERYEYPSNIQLLELDNVRYLYGDFIFGYQGVDNNKARASLDVYLEQLGSDTPIYVIYNSDLNAILCDFLQRVYVYVPSYIGTQGQLDSAVFSKTYDQLAIANNKWNYYSNISSSTSTAINEGDIYDANGGVIVKDGDYIDQSSVNNGDTIGTLIDLTDSTIKFVDENNFDYSTSLDIGEIKYDEENYTYHITANSGNTTYNYQYTFYNDYTYVIYLGSSEEYQPKAYKFYYELPDGRSSADLTADELAGMSVQFADVVTYDRAASDEVVEGLWHLDGSLENTAFNNNSQMYFNSGASISYIEDAGFEGALYLPALNGPREWWTNIGISTDNGTVLPQSVQDYFSSIFTYPHDQLYSSNVKSYNINDNSFNFSVDFRFYNYADANDSTGTMFTYQPYFNEILEMSKSPFVGDLASQTLQFFKIDFLGSSLKFYNQAGTNTTTVSYSPGTWNHILVNYSFTLGRYGQNSAVGDVPTTYSITYLPSVTVYLNGVLVYSFESTNTSNSAYYLNNRFYSSTNYNTAVNYFINGNKFPNALQGVKFSSTSNTVPFAIDEIRITDTNVPNLVSPVPYEDNLVWVLPDSTNLAANTLAIQSDYLSGKYRVGGIRPSMVEKGHVWFQISMNRIISCQVYNGIMWEEVNCYVWTGSRWIPANYFDVVTLTDYYDIADNTGLPTITTSEGFFSWFQREFKEFKDKAVAFFDAWEGGSGGQGGTTNNNVTIIAPSLTANGTLDATIAPDITFEFDLGNNAADLLTDGFEGVSGVFRGVFGLVGEVFSLGSESITMFFRFFDSDTQGITPMSLWSIVSE